MIERAAPNVGELPSDKRLAIVVQRYGNDVNGGAEVHARTIAIKLSERYKVDVFTTCASDNRHWDHAFLPGESFEGNVRILRFSQKSRGNVWRRRTPLAVSQLFKRAQSGELTPPYVAAPTSHTLTSEMKWLAAQGPDSESLASYLHAHLAHYCAVIVFSLRYWTAVRSLQVAADKAILVPTLHDEKAMYRGIYQDALARARVTMFNTNAELDLAQRLYGRVCRQSEVVGAGVNTGLPSQTQRLLAKQKLGVDHHYIIYTGRINQAKGCDLLIRAFDRFQAAFPNRYKLLLLGRIEMALPSREWLVAPGFVDDITRDGVLADASALVLPSRFESLSLSTLEAMAFGIPIVVNSGSEVLVEHVRQSGTGYLFQDEVELCTRLVELQNLDAHDRAAIAQHSREYVQSHYSWHVVLERIDRVIEMINADPSTRATR